MGNAATDLAQRITDSKQYWKSRNLILAYTENSILPLLRDSLLAIIPDIEDRHILDSANYGTKVKCIHYTSIRTLLSMLQAPKGITSSYLRMYDSLHFNDPDEGNFLLRSLNNGNQFPWTALDTTTLLDSIESEVAYVASFVLADALTNAADDLVFWRTYGDEGRGCSLAFSLEIGGLRKVLYGDDIAQTIQTIEPILTLINPLFSNSIPGESELKRLVMTTVAATLRPIRYLYKSEPYRYEREVRVITLPSDKISDKVHFDYHETQKGQPTIRHYLNYDKVNLKDLLSSGSKVTVGPSVPHRDDVLECLRILKKRTDFAGEITASTISYGRRA